MSETRNCGCVVPRLTALADICGKPFDIDNPITVKSDQADGWGLIDEVTGDLVVYMGFPALISADNPDEDDPLCAILKVETVGTVTTRKWSGGTMAKEYLWSNRTALEYHFLS
jgi:hypothetical protein